MNYRYDMKKGMTESKINCSVFKILKAAQEAGTRKSQRVFFEPCHFLGGFFCFKGMGEGRCLEIE